VSDRSDADGAPAVRWSTVAILTLGSGIAVTISWFAFFRSLDSYGPELDAMLRPTRLAVYATQFAMIIPFAFWLARRRLRGARLATLAAVAFVSWLLQGVILTMIGAPLIANELDPEVAWYYWLAATAGPIQPAVALLASWLGARPATATT
jgi:hypothetical protein